MPDDKSELKQPADATTVREPVVPAKKVEAKLRLPKISEISVWLDTYDDLFSDFDPRPYDQRAISADFIEEAKVFSREKQSGQFELVLLIPRKLQDAEKEKVILPRLHESFGHNRQRLRQEIKKIRLNGTRLILGSMVLLLAATWISMIPNKTWLVNFSLILLEPAGWFTIWNGLDLLFFAPGKKQADLDFYQRMADCQIVFMPY
jgi:hypothetical protein